MPGQLKGGGHFVEESLTPILARLLHPRCAHTTQDEEKAVDWLEWEGAGGREGRKRVSYSLGGHQRMLHSHWAPPTLTVALTWYATV